jgi:hypothetical protein
MGKPTLRVVGSVSHPISTQRCRRCGGIHQPSAPSAQRQGAERVPTKSDWTSAFGRPAQTLKTPSPAPRGSVPPPPSTADLVDAFQETK